MLKHARCANSLFALKPLVLGIASALYMAQSFATPVCGATTTISANTGMYLPSSTNCITINNGVTVDSIDNTMFGYAIPIFTNNGTITQEFHNHDTVSLLVNNGAMGSIVHGDYTEIQNFGTISDNPAGQGLSNLTSIGTLLNAQGGGSPLTITGNLPSNYQIYVSSLSSYGKLSATGPAGTMTFGIAAGSTLSSNTYASVLSGIQSSNLTGSLNGTFGAFNWLLSDGSTLNDGIWDLVVSSAQTFRGATQTLNPIANGAASVLDANTNLSSLFTGMSGSQGYANAAVQALPLLTGNTSIVAQSTLQNVNQIIQARLGKSSGNDFYGDKHFWVKPFGSRADQDERNGVAGFKSESYGLAAGFDGTLSPALRVGGALAYARTDVSSRSSVAPQSADVDTYQLIGYGSYALDDRTEIDFQADVGQNVNKGRRSILLAGTTAISDFRSDTAHFGLGLGRTYTLTGDTSLTPTIRMDYTRIKDKAYTETGAGLLNLNVDSRSTEALVLSVGGRVAHQLNDQTTLSANLGVGYDTLSKQASITAVFAGAPGAAFVTQGIDPSPWIGQAGIGAVYKTKLGFELTGRYDVEYRESFLNQTASVKARWAF